MAKQFSSCHWVPSRIIEEQLTGYVVTGALANEVIHWRVPGTENPPEPQDGEVVVFMQHLDRGFSPPGSKNSVMYLLASNSILKTLDRTLCPTSAISKCSVKFTFKKNQLLNSSGTSST